MGANAKRANMYRARYLAYHRKYVAVARNCAKSRASWARLTNAQARAQRKYIAVMKRYRRSAGVYKRRHVAYLKLFRVRTEQRQAAYARYNKYVKNANAWARNYNRAARG